MGGGCISRWVPPLEQEYQTHIVFALSLSNIIQHTMAPPLLPVHCNDPDQTLAVHGVQLSPERIWVQESSRRLQCHLPQPPNWPLF